MTGKMVHVRMLFDKRGGGRYDGREWPAYGEVFLVPQWEADEMIACGDAELATEPEKKLSWDVLREPRLDWDAPETEEAPEDKVTVSHDLHDDDWDDDFDRDEPDEEEDDFDRETPVKPVKPKKPSTNQPKAAWIKYAVANGATIAEANGMTKADLIARYGK